MRRLISAWITVFWLAAATLSAWGDASRGTPVKVVWAGDGRSFSLVAPGLTGFQAVFSATIERNGETNVLSSSEGVAFESTRQELEITPCGQATIRTRTFHFEKNAIDLLFRLPVD